MSDLTDISRLIDKAIEVSASAGIDRSIYAIEECSELIKELTKAQRRKGSYDAIVDEACDVLASVFALLRNLDVSEETIRNNIVYKYERAIKRHYETGEV